MYPSVPPVRLRAVVSVSVLFTWLVATAITHRSGTSQVGRRGHVRESPSAAEGPGILGRTCRCRRGLLLFAISTGGSCPCWYIFNLGTQRLIRTGRYRLDRRLA